jgi:hypothetical protein
MMNYEDLKNLAHLRLRAREEELSTKRSLVRLEADLSSLKGSVLATAYADGTISGKNADVRKRQEEAAISSSGTYQEQVVRLHRLEELADIGQAEREYLDDLVSLTKAWLYSQSGS